MINLYKFLRALFLKGDYMNIINELHDLYMSNKEKFIFEEAHNLQYDEIGKFVFTLVNTNNKYYIFIFYVDNNIIFKSKYSESDFDNSEQYFKVIEDLESLGEEEFLKKYYETLKANY